MCQVKKELKLKHFINQCKSVPYWNAKLEELMQDIENLEHNALGLHSVRYSDMPRNISDPYSSMTKTEYVDAKNELIEQVQECVEEISEVAEIIEQCSYNTQKWFIDIYMDGISMKQCANELNMKVDRARYESEKEILEIL